MDFNALTLSMLLVVLASFICGTFVLMARPLTAIKLIWGALSYAIGFWALGYGLMVSAQDYDLALLSARFSNLSAILIPLFYLHFTLKITQQLPPKQHFLAISYTVTFLYFFISIIWVDLFIPGGSPIMGLYFYLDPGPVYSFFPILYTFLAGCSSYFLYEGTKARDFRKGNQLKYVFLGTSLGFLGGAFTFLAVYDIPFYPYTTFLIPLFPLSVGYAVVKHNLMDIQFIIKKGVLYTATVSATTVFFFLLIHISERFLQTLIGYSSLTQSLVIALLCAIFFTPLKNFIERYLERFFFHSTFIGLTDENLQLKTHLSASERHRMASTLASSVAHEIRNPLTAIRAYIENAHQNKSDPVFWKKFQEITSREIQRIDRLLTDLMDFTQPRPLQMESHDLNHVVRQTLDLASSRIRQNGIDVQLKLSEMPVPTPMDNQQIQQVILNLVFNAVEAMPDGGILTITTENDQLRGISRLNIKDTGCGMSAEQVKHIFEPFYTTKSGGHGLGMAVVKQILDSHGWKTKIASETGQGMEFKIDISEGTKA